LKVDPVQQKDTPSEKYFKSSEVFKSKLYEIPKEIPIKTLFDESKETEVVKNYPIDQSQQVATDHLQWTKFDEILRHMQAPPVELDVFSGNVIDYPHFIATFTEVVESTITNPRGRLVRLIKYLKDEAKELAESCNHLPPEEGYERAKNLLDNQYGDRYRILSQ